MDVTRLILPKRSTDYAYEKGYDCGLNGANMDNCHFAIFSTPENTRAWEQGKRDAEGGKARRQPGT